MKVKYKHTLFPHPYIIDYGWDTNLALSFLENTAYEKSQLHRIYCPKKVNLRVSKANQRLYSTQFWKKLPSGLHVRNTKRYRDIVHNDLSHIFVANIDINFIRLLVVVSSPQNQFHDSKKQLRETSFLWIIVVPKDVAFLDFSSNPE